MKPVFFDVRDDNAKKLIDEINRERLNKPLLFFLSLFVLGFATGSFVAYKTNLIKKPAKPLVKKKKSKPKVIKLAEFEVETLSKVEIELPSKDFADKFPECRGSSIKVVEKEIKITRIITKSFKRLIKAKHFARHLKKEAPFLDPWVLKSKRGYLVVAGSYISEKNIDSTVEFLKKKGLPVRIEKVPYKKIRRFVLECNVPQKDKEFVMQRAQKLNLKVREL